MSLHYIYSLLVSSNLSVLYISFLTHNSTVLDPHILYQGLLADCDDDSSLKEDIDWAKTLLEEHYQSYHYHEPHPLLMTASQQFGTSPQKVNFTAQYQQCTPATCNDLGEYFKLPQEDFEACNPLTWWADHQSQFPNLSCFTCDLLGIPGILFLTF